MPKMIHDSETPAVGQQVIVACAFIHHNFDGVEKVCLAQRSTEKKFFPGVYELPGGHVDFGENIVAALQREIAEELHKDIEVGDPFSVFTYMNDIKGAHAIEVCYFAQFKGRLDDVKLEPADHTRWSWFSEEEEATFSVNREPDDYEIAVMGKGFALLKNMKITV